jgi:hypothetical protein
LRVKCTLVHRSALIAVFVVGLFPSAASAHGRHYEGYVSTVSGVEPNLPGLLIDVIGGDERLAVRNLTQSTVLFFDARGRPVATVRAGGSASWHEPRIHASGPPPERSQLVRRWRIRGEADGRLFVVNGYLGYAAPAGRPADGTGVRRVAAIALLTALLLTALALPLVVRRKGEGE